VVPADVVGSVVGDRATGTACPSVLPPIGECAVRGALDRWSRSEALDPIVKRDPQRARRRITRDSNRLGYTVRFDPIQAA